MILMIMTLKFLYLCLSLCVVSHVLWLLAIIGVSAWSVSAWSVFVCMYVSGVLVRSDRGFRLTLSAAVETQPFAWLEVLLASLVAATGAVCRGLLAGACVAGWCMCCVVCLAVCVYGCVGREV